MSAEASATMLSTQFAAAVQAAERACLNTSVAAMGRSTRAAQLRAAIGAPAPKALAALLVEIAGPSFVSQLAQDRKLNAFKATQLGEALLEMAWAATPPPQTVSAGLDPAMNVRRLELLSRVLQRWIDFGPQVPSADLSAAGQLVTRPEQRLALLAPAASALGVCLAILKSELGWVPTGAAA